MSLNRADKTRLISEVKAQVALSHSIVLAEYRGLSVSAMTVLRRQARLQRIPLKVLKNSLARKAVVGTAFEGLASKMLGPLIYAFSDDPVAGAKVLHDFAKENEKLVITAGAMPGIVLSPSEVRALAVLPSRDELLAQLMRTMKEPVSRFVQTLNEVPARFVRLLGALRDKRVAAGL